MPPASARRSAAHAREHLVALLTPVVERTGHDLDDVTVTCAGRRSIVRVVIDADGGVSLDAIAQLSRAVSDALDSDAAGGALFAGPYSLEVSSPGVDRPLTTPRHWRRALGRLVTVRVGEQTLTGRVAEVGDDGVGLDVEGSRREACWADLGAGRVQVEFTRPGAARTEGEEG